MQADEFVRMAEVQDRHWWFEAKRRTVGALLARHRVTGRGPTAQAPVLEVGPGTGAMIEVMARHGRVLAADAYLPALRLLAEHRAGAAVVPVGADLRSLPFADGVFSLIGCFDVLYHRQVGSVTGAIGELHRVCAPGGYLTITDSAFSFLRSSHDVATHAARRFRLPELIAPLRAAGFTIAHASYFHTLLFPAAAVLRLGKRALHGSPPLQPAGSDGAPGTAAGPPGGARGQSAGSRPAAAASANGSGDTDGVPARSDLAPVAPWLNALLGSLYRLEVPLTTRFRMPFGVSLLILARRSR